MIILNKHIKKISKVEETKKEPMTKEQATAKAAELAAEGVGRYILAWANPGSTKLTLKSLKKDDTDEKFKMFCVSWDEVTMDGLVLAKIEGFRIDKKNNIYMVAKPMLELKEVKALFNSGVWDFFLPYDVMWQPYGTSREVTHECFNVDNAYKKLGYEVTENEADVRHQMWNDMINGKFTFVKLTRMLNTANTYQIEARKLYKAWKGNNLSITPLLKSRLDREEMKEKELVEFLAKEHAAYEKLGLTGAKNLFEEAEVVIAHYAKIREAEKAAKKTAKLKDKVVIQGVSCSFIH